MRRILDVILKNKYLEILIKYTLCFLIVSLLIFKIYYQYGLNFIWVGGMSDGLNQHFVTLNYFRDILNNLFTHHSLDTFTWNIGFGMDMFGNLAYYIFGDIFSYLCVFFSKDKLKYLYFGLVFVRLYASGMSFLFYCIYNKRRSISSVIGSLLYISCSFALFSAVRHPYFINAMIVFPMSMIGIEKFVNEGKKLFYIFSVFLMFFSSFYFGYMNAIVIAIYGILLCLRKYKKDYKMVFFTLVKALLYASVGLMMSAFILIPTIYAFVNSTRVDVIADISYSVNYYRELLESLVTPRGATKWSVIGISSIFFFCLPIFLRKYKKNWHWILLMLILVLPLLSSKISFIISGMGYPSNRYVYMLIFTFAYMVVMVIDDKIEVDIKLIKIYLMMGICYLLLLVFFDIRINMSMIVSLIVFMAICYIYLSKKNKFIYDRRLNFTCLVVILGILFNVYYIYDVRYGNYVSEFVSNYDIENIYNTYNHTIEDYKQAISDIKKSDKSFYRVATLDNSMYNLGLFMGYNSINYFYSINSSLYQKLSDDLQNSKGFTNVEIGTFDNRIKINSLLGVKYYVTGSKINLYGYDLEERYKNNTYVYKSNNSASFANLFTECISEDDYNKLNSLEKEDALLKYYVSSKCRKGNYENKSIKKVEFKSKYKIKNKLKLDKKTRVNLSLKNKVNGELYLKISNIKYSDLSDEEKINNQFGEGAILNKRMVAGYNDSHRFDEYDNGFTINVKAGNVNNSEVIYSNKYPYYSGKDDILINLGYFGNYDGDVIVDFSKLGIYKFDEFSLYEVSLDDYKNDIKEINNSNFSVSSVGDNYLNGNVDSASDGVLRFSTLYNEGFTIFIDGKKSNSFRDKYFLATKIKKGKHKIKLVYRTPYLKEGMLVSGFGFLIFIGIFVGNITRRKNKL